MQCGERSFDGGKRAVLPRSAKNFTKGLLFLLLRCINPSDRIHVAGLGSLLLLP